MDTSATLSSQFSRAFKQVHGTTFREFVIIHRIRKAEQISAERPKTSRRDQSHRLGRVLPFGDYTCSIPDSPIRIFSPDCL